MKLKTLDALNQILNSNLHALKSVTGDFHIVGRESPTPDDVAWIEKNIESVLKKMLDVVKKPAVKVTFPPAPSEEKKEG